MLACAGKAYGERPDLQLNPRLYPELQAFLDTWRQELKPAHSRVFSQLNGAPLTEQAIYKIFRTCAYRWGTGWGGVVWSPSPTGMAWPGMLHAPKPA